MALDNADKEFSVLHVVAKATKRKGMVTNPYGDRIYSLVPGEVKTLNQFGDDVFYAGGMRFVFKDDTLTQTAFLSPDSIPIQVLDHTPRKGMAKWWRRMPISERSALAKQACLEGKVGSRECHDMTTNDKAAIRGLRREADGVDSKPVLSDERPVQKKKSTEKAKEPVEGPSVEKEAKDLIMWVGTRHYPTIADFVKEARTQGCSKRIGRILHSVVLDKTRIFLAHDEGLKGEGMLFGYFHVARIELIVHDLNELPENYNKVCTVIPMSRARREPVRGCGWRDAEGALYFSSETDPVRLKQTARERDVPYKLIKGGLVTFEVPRDYNAFVEGEGKHFRGALQIDQELGDRIISVRKSRYLKVPPSLEFEKPKQEPKWDSKADRALMRAMRERSEPKSQVFTRFALDTGRNRSKVVYRHQLLREKR